MNQPNEMKKETSCFDENGNYEAVTKQACEVSETPASDDLSAARFIPVTQGSQPSVKPVYQPLDNLFAWLSILTGFLFVRTLPVVENTLGALLMVLCLFAFGGIYLVRSKVHLSPVSIGMAVVACLYTVGFLTGANQTLQRLLFCFLICSFLYWLYGSCGLSGAWMFAKGCVWHMLNAVFSVPLASVTHFFRALFAGEEKRGRGKFLRNLLWCVVGLFVAVIPTTIIILLLSYDEGFMDLLENVIRKPLEHIGEYLLDLIWGFFVAMLLFGAMFGAKWKRQLQNGEAVSFGNTDFHRIPKALMCAAVTPILGVYVIFFISQWNYYLSAFTKVLPDGLTYADYARNGFFELCSVCAINAVMLLVFSSFIRRKEGGKNLIERIYSALISLFTLVLIATALSKMVLYIDSYGLTQKRVYASWLILLLGAVFIAVLVRQFWDRLPLITVIVAICVVFFGLVAIPDVDGMIANYNVDAYLSGDLKEMDVESLSEYDVSAVPALLRLEAALEEKPLLDEYEQELSYQVDRALNRVAIQLSRVEDHLLGFNIPTARARGLLEERIAEVKK